MMIRLTLLLLAGIAVTFAVAGRDVPAAAEGVEVARSETDLTDAGTDRLSLDDEAGAVRRALDATTQPASPQVREASFAPAASAATSQTAPSDATREQALVTADRVNLRAGPSTANQVLDQVVRDQRVDVLERNDDGWVRIHVTETGLDAWIFGRFLQPLG